MEELGKGEGGGPGSIATGKCRENETNGEVGEKFTNFINILEKPFPPAEEWNR